MKMLGLTSNSIRRTLMYVLLLTSSSALIAATLGFAISDWLSLKESTFTHLRSQASVIGYNSSAAITFNDPMSADETLSSLKNDNNIIGAILFDNNNQVFASYLSSPDEPLNTIPPTMEMGERNGMLFVYLPVIFDQEVIGTILVYGRLNYWQQRQFSHLLTLFGLCILSLMLAWALSSRLQKLVTYPILKLAQTARYITQQQDYSLRAEKLSRDEIGVLVDDFNLMLEQIDLRDNKLRRARDELEEKVQERTAELTELTRELEHQAYHDTLTGLANRSTYDDHLKFAIDEAKTFGGKIAVLFLDLDRFKVINDTLGHAVGDKLLIQVANRLSKNLRSKYTLARLGGDEFGVLLTHSSPVDAGQVAQRLVTAINEPVLIDGYSMHLSTSIGISVYPEDGSTAEEILKNADTAMYRSKESGRNQYTFFKSEMNSRSIRRLNLENKLRDAIKNNKLQVYYQPQWETQTRKLVGVEALARWFDEDDGYISPVEFIPLANECGLISAIDEWVLERATTDAMSWYGEVPPSLTLAVNLSPSNFIRKDLVASIVAILSRTGFPADKLEFEITEDLFGPGTDDVYTVLADLQNIGIKFSIDDFGKAYSSLSRLKQLPLHTLKIDQSFIRDLATDPDDATIVRTIITMAHSLNLDVVAEGIETEEQLAFVKAHFCDFVQGFLLGKPMPADDIKELLRQSGQIS